MKINEFKRAHFFHQSERLEVIEAQTLFGHSNTQMAHRVDYGNISNSDGDKKHEYVYIKLTKKKKTAQKTVVVPVHVTQVTS